MLTPASRFIASTRADCGSCCDRSSADTDLLLGVMGPGDAAMSRDYQQQISPSYGRIQEELEVGGDAEAALRIANVRCDKVS